MLQLSMPLLLSLGFLFMVPSVVRGVAGEKETGIKVRLNHCSIGCEEFIMSEMLFDTFYVWICIVFIGIVENDGTAKLDALAGLDA